ncbi:hypothetical protein CALVIDRAFT_438013 [Calocera viscosa TUFC12733]|uniref:Uncharacterized protein n=1 Tax=Calocera viscosa (strain TUFC12733) TaxID=1330018 RepID=A0A167FTM2_CALVF|nr:hypothetical protein CALVIDRAFT_438013 [Calocera viscosa TUFC12733]
MRDSIDPGCLSDVCCAWRSQPAAVQAVQVLRHNQVHPPELSGNMAGTSQEEDRASTMYDPKRARRLPLILFLRRFSLSTVGLLALRGALVGLVWLALNVETLLWSGDALSWFVAGRPPRLGPSLLPRQ